MSVSTLASTMTIADNAQRGSRWGKEEWGRKMNMRWQPETALAWKGNPKHRQWDKGGRYTKLEDISHNVSEKIKHTWNA